MNLHHNFEDFEEIIQLTSSWINIPLIAIKRDYFIVIILKNLAGSAHAEDVVFKGGTSLSKCYKGSIDRFSEDIDLTYIPKDNESDKQVGKLLKEIERILIGDAKFEIIGEERNNRNKSCYVWFHDESKEDEKIKLEIGSSVKPHPFSKRVLRSYVHEYLIEQNMDDIIDKYNLEEVELNVLNIERTFIDKIMAIKRHAFCMTLSNKSRHIYDIVRLYQLEEIKEFIKNKFQLKEIIKETKNTDSFYLKKRNISKDYNPMEPYDFDTWENKLDNNIRKSYESLHKNILYSKEKQDFDHARDVLSEISQIFSSIGE